MELAQLEGVLPRRLRVEDAETNLLAALSRADFSEPDVARGRLVTRDFYQEVPLTFRLRVRNLEELASATEAVAASSPLLEVTRMRLDVSAGFPTSVELTVSAFGLEELDRADEPWLVDLEVAGMLSDLPKVRKTALRWSRRAAQDGLGKRQALWALTAAARDGQGVDGWGEFTAHLVQAAGVHAEAAQVPVIERYYAHYPARARWRALRLLAQLPGRGAGPNPRGSARSGSPPG